MTPPDGFSLDALDSRPDAPWSAAPSVAAPSVAPPSVAAYAVPCRAGFAAAVQALARARGVGVSALASCALLLVPDRMPDPGVPDPGIPDSAEERAVLALRLQPGLEAAAIRRALAAALALADPGLRLVPAAQLGHLEAAVETLTYRNKALAHALERVSFRPLDGPMTQVRDAAQLFGFINEWCFDEDRVVKRFRELAPVYHPDTGVVACRERMAQLIDARNLLIRHVRTAYRSGAWAERR